MVSAYYQEREEMSNFAGRTKHPISLKEYLRGFVGDYRDNFQTRYLLGRPMM